MEEGRIDLTPAHSEQRKKDWEALSAKVDQLKKEMDRSASPDSTDDTLQSRNYAEIKREYDAAVSKAREIQPAPYRKNTLLELADASAHYSVLSVIGGFLIWIGLRRRARLGKSQ